MRQDAHLQLITEVLQSIKASEMSPLLKSIYATEGGSEALDVLIKYMYAWAPPTHRFSPRSFDLTWDVKHSYKGMASGSSSKTPSKVTPQPTGGFSQVGGRPGATEPSQAGMSVLLSWHEKTVEVAGIGSIARTMTDWRRV